MHSSKIASLKSQYVELINFCKLNKEITFETYVNDAYRKNLLLSAASYFETEIIQMIRNYVVNNSNNNIKIISFLNKKALERQYHTFFDWKANNANKFFDLFGEEFKEKAKSEIKNRHLENAQTAFINIGSKRNDLVHNNFIEFKLDDTFDELFQKYEQACLFVELIKVLLEDKN